MPIQQMLLGVGGAADSLIGVEDVFKTYVYKGTGSSLSINNSIDLAGEGGMVWTKQRDNTMNSYHYLADTERGITNYLIPSENSSSSNDSNRFASVSSTGFTIGTEADINTTDKQYVSWTVRKQKKFFTIKTYTGNGLSQSLSHDLGSVPGCIIIKRTDSANDWGVYHRGVNGGTNPQNYGMFLNSTSAKSSASNAYWNDTAPTATQFSVGDDAAVNANTNNYVAYLFADSSSSAANARSVQFDGSDYLTVGTGADIGSGDFTLECWINKDVGGTYSTIVDNRASSSSSNGFIFYVNDAAANSDTSITRTLELWNGGSLQMSTTITCGQWHHLALVRNSGTTSLYKDGTSVGSFSDSGTHSAITSIGRSQLDSGSNYYFWGRISNFRITSGQALYTSNFTPATVPLTTTSQSATSSNVKILCCNGPSATSSSVTPGTITANGDPEGIGSNPFPDPDDTAIFGPNSDQSIISCGSYAGTGSAGLVVGLPFEPSFLMVKNETSSGQDWIMWDSIRGINTGSNDPIIRANLNNAEATDTNHLSLTPTGFKVTSTNDGVNKSGDTYIYIAIAAETGKTMKAIETGSDVFTMDLGNSSSSIPSMDSGFAVDMTIYTQPASTSHNWLTARLIGQKEQKINGTDAQGDVSDSQWDSNVGWGENHNSNYQSWMWKRHAGFDVVTYKGNQVLGRQIPHNLSKAPEMVWIKDRDNVQNWAVGHKGLNGGSSPWDYYVLLNENYAEASYTYWDNESSVGTAPTSTHVTIGSSIHINKTDQNYIMMLFASVKGVSHCGSFTGNGSTQTITIPNGGFQPRFVIIKNSDDTYSWVTLDTTRGWGSGNDKLLRLDLDSSEVTADYGAPTSTGFTVTSNSSVNADGQNFIYYAHA